MLKTKSSIGLDLEPVSSSSHPSNLVKLYMLLPYHLIYLSDGSFPEGFPFI